MQAQRGVSRHTADTYCNEPVWPSGKALGWQAEGPRFDPLRLSFLFKNCGLWTLSCDFAHTINETLKMAHTTAHLSAESFWW